MLRTPKSRPAEDLSATATDERRAHVRFPCELDSSCTPVAGNRGMQWTGKICDISKGGIGIALTRRFELGTLLTIEIQEADGRSSGTLLARVVHVTPHSLGGWVVGCCFTNELGEDEVRALAQDGSL